MRSVQPRFPDDLNVAQLAAELHAAGTAAGFAVEPYGSTAEAPLLALTRTAPPDRPAIYVSAGIHGDEPAPPLALLRLLRSGFFDDRAQWFLCPLLHPGALHRRSREDPFGRDLNRDYRNPQSNEVRQHLAWLQRQPRFAATFCLHEDWEAQGFYCYELNPTGLPSLAPALLAAVSAVCTIDVSPQIDGWAASDGLIRPQIDPAEREQWPEAIHLVVHHTALSYTFETPSASPIPVRIAAHCTALEAAVGALAGSTPSPPHQAP
jgi:protein MpaA